MQAPVRAPFDGWPIHHEDEDFGYAWWCEKAVIVVQTTVDCGSERAAAAYHRFEDAIIRRQDAQIEEHGGLYVLHDWRSIQTHDSAGRTYWQDKMRSRPAGYLRGSAVCLDRVKPLLKMAIQAANLVASLSKSGTVEVSEDIRTMVAKVRPQPVARFIPVTSVRPPPMPRRSRP